MTDQPTGGRTTTVLQSGWTYIDGEVPPAAPYAEAVDTGVPVTLPHTWNAVDGQDGGNDYRRGKGTYLRDLGQLRTDRELWLEVDGANSSAEVFLNGTRVGRHDGGYSTFRVNLTPAIAATNRLAIVVDNAANDTVYPQRADFTFYGGLYRDVRLITVASAHFGLDDHGGPGLVVTPTMVGSSAQVHLTASVTGGDVVRFTIAGSGSVDSPITAGEASASMEITDVRRWHGLSDPYLYTAKAELLDGGSVVDAVSLRFGCREMAVDPDRGFLLNGEPYALRGVSRHQDWEGVGNAVTTAMLQTDLDLLVELGATTVRLAHYQHDQRFYDLCDEAGIVVWAEIPQITMFHQGATRNAADQLTELIVQNRHHASIACWGLSNEITIGGLTDDLVAAHHELNDLAHQLDPSRLTCLAHAFVLEPGEEFMTLADVMSYNLYYGWYLGELEDNDRWFSDFRAAYPGVAIGLSEYGADANPTYQTATPTKGDYSESYQARYHEHMVDLIERSPYLWATHVWNLADFGADGRNEGGNWGRNQKGLVTFDRALKKDAFYVYKAAWSAEPFVHVAGRRYVDRPEELTQVTVYSNQPEVSLYRDGHLVAARTGSRVFRFEVPLEGKHTLEARAGELTDRISVRKVDEANPTYSFEASTVLNWFAEDLPAPDGFYSVWDSMGAIKQSPAGEELLARLMRQAAATRGDVARDVVIPASMQAILDRQTVEGLLKHLGDAVPATLMVELNMALNQIPRQEAPR
ncbi:MAG TPA: glycoside hydrolase family 2 TIM barrel-domain containing protein [Propionibacteriaceae bacterium]|nr:glycoside hydrolase family 2 TIM barrel-domain containing protein [Propionibacteriaceae bacterium]